MKKIFIILLCAALLSACSIRQAATPTALAFTNTPTDIPSATPTIVTPTFTATPTLVGQKTATNTPDFTPTALPVTPFFLITPDTVTPGMVMKGFISVSVSGTAFYKPAGCEPLSVKFNAQTGDPRNTAFVVLAVRFKSKQTGTTSEWTNLTMESLGTGTGTFTHSLISEEMKSAASYKNAWVQYQFIATDSKANEIGRTGVFSEGLTLLECEPPTSTPSLTPTPTALKP